MWIRAQHIWSVIVGVVEADLGQQKIRGRCDIGVISIVGEHFSVGFSGA